MKPRKTRWPIVIVGILLVIVLGGLSTVHAQQVQEGNQLSGELSLVEQRLNSYQLSELSSQKAEMEKQLGQALAELETAKAALSQPTDSIAAIDALFGIAEACDVEIVKISLSGLAGDDLAGVTCSILPFAIEAEGDAPSLINFIIKLNGDLTNSVVNSAEISMNETDDMENPSTEINLVIYFYQGD